MPPSKRSQGLNSSMHAPPFHPSSDKNNFTAPTDNRNHGSRHNPANNSANIPASVHGSASKPTPTPTTFTPTTTPSSTSPASPTQPANTQGGQGEAVVTAEAEGGDNSGRAITKSLRLTPVYVIGSSSTLPNFSIDTVLMQYTGEGYSFVIERLAAGIIQGCSVEALKLYLDSFHRREVEYMIKWLVMDRHPVLCYAAERNCVDCIRLLLDYGCDPNTCDVDNIPALAYAIMRSKSTVVNPAEVVRMLLAFGAKPDCVPRDMWSTYLEAPKAIQSENEASQLDQAARWCSDYYRKILASTLNLSVRYYLYRADQIELAKERKIQLAKAFNYTALLKVPYLIIGQDYATKLVVDVPMQIKTPLVLVFAGLSGHGKTELAKQMGSLLQLPMTVVDCTQMSSNIALFGSHSGYIGNNQGSQLNNHLADHSGERSVVFLDEFDKTDREVHNALLLVLDSGEYHDRRNNKALDASKTIWIMATNLDDREITHFYRNDLEDVEPADRVKAPYTTLTETLKSRFRDTFGAPMAGRMKNVAPFFPFQHNEQAVVVHKFLMELVEQVRQLIDTSIPNKNYAAHVHLAIKNDGKLCAYLAHGYLEALGARFLISTMEQVRLAFFRSFTDTNELISDDMNDGALMKFTAQLQPVAETTGVSEVGVVRDGYTNYYRGQDSGDGNEMEWLNTSMSKMMEGDGGVDDDGLEL